MRPRGLKRKLNCCGFVVDLLFNLLYNESTTKRSDGVWALPIPLKACPHWQQSFRFWQQFVAENGNKVASVDRP